MLFLVANFKLKMVPVSKMTGETPEVHFDKRKPREKKEREKREKKRKKRENDREKRETTDVHKMLLAEILKTIEILECSNLKKLRCCRPVVAHDNVKGSCRS